MRRRKPSFTSLFKDNAPGEQAVSEYNQVVTKVEHARKEREQAERALEHETGRYAQHQEQYDRNIREAHRSWELAVELAMQQQEQDMTLAMQQQRETLERCQQAMARLREPFVIVVRTQQSITEINEQFQQETARYQQIRLDLETDQARAVPDLDQALRQAQDRLRQARAHAQDDFAQAEEQAWQGQQQAQRSVEQAQDRVRQARAGLEQAQRAQQDLQQGLEARSGAGPAAGPAR